MATKKIAKDKLHQLGSYQNLTALAIPSTNKNKRYNLSNIFHLHLNYNTPFIRSQYYPHCSAIALAIHLKVLNHNYKPHAPYL